MDELTTAALAELSFPDWEYAQAWQAHLLDVRQSYPPVEDWDAFAAALTERSTDLGLAEDGVRAFFEKLTASGDPAAAIDVICAESLTAPEAEAADAQYDEGAWFAFLTEEGQRWDGFAESWPVFREWFVYTATERGFGQPAQQLMDYVENAPSPWRAMVDYGVPIDPLAGFPEVAELAACETDDDLRRLLTTRTGVDFTGVEA
jgi:hypothetical protein